jgi:hypothetical protein
MSSDEILSDRDLQILDAAASEDDDRSDGRDDLRQQLEDLREIVEQQAQTIEQNAREIRRLENSREYIANELDRLKRQTGDIDLSHYTELERYTQMVEDGVGATLDGSLRRAVAIHQNWDRWSQTFGNTGTNKFGVERTQQVGISTRIKSTRKYAPSKIRVQLEDELGEDLHSEQVVRALKMLAKKSVTDDEEATVERDRANRLHITGGDYEFHERTSPDAEDDTTYYVVVKA